VLPLPAGDRNRLMVIEREGKERFSLAGTPELTLPPFTMAGPDQVACLIGRGSHREIALIKTTTRSVANRIPFDKGPITSLASLPDGKTLYCAANGKIWQIPVSNKTAKELRPGKFVAVDRDGRYLVIQAIEAARSRLYRLPLDGGQEKVIPLNGPFGLNPQSGISTQALRDNRLLVCLALPDSWYFAPGWIDISTGQMTRIPIDYLGDFHYLGWTDGGQIVAGAQDFRSTLWKFRPQSRKD
jgi:hypothetical protein